MGSTEAKVVQLNLKINGEGAFNTLKDLNEHVSALRQKMHRMSKEDTGYEQTAQKLRNCIDQQKAWREEIYGTQKASKGFFEDFKANLASIVGGVTIGTLLANGISSAIGSIRQFVSTSEAVYKEAEQNQAQLAAVIQSTGGAAGRTQEQLNALSTALMNQTGIDDDLIAKSEALLLTFTNISGKIYDQTLPLILDMSKALGQDLQTSSIQVGKALNDPIQGMTALKRVGVSFSEQQAQVIRRLQETGDIAGAQKVILQELTKEFGGVAQALSNTESGALDRFNTRMGNIQESIGGLITSMKAASLEALEPFVNWLERATATDLASKLKEEQTQLNGLVRAISMTNNNQAVRNQLIAELQGKYPDFLGKIKAEDVSNELLARRLEAVNNQYREKIFIAVNEEKIKAIQEKRNKAIQEEATARMEVAKASKLSATALAKLSDQEVEALAKKQRAEAAYADMRRGGSMYSAGTSSTGNREAKNLEFILNGRKRIAESLKEEGDLMAANTIYSNRAKELRLQAIDEEITKLHSLKSAQSSLEIERLKNEKNSLLGIAHKPSKGDGNEEEKGVKTLGSKVNVEVKKTIVDFEKLSEEYQKLKVSQLYESLSLNEKEIQQEKAKYQVLIEEREQYLQKAGLTKEQKTEVNSQITHLKATEKTALQNIEVRQEKERIEQIAALRAQFEVVKEKEADKEVRLIKQKYAQLKEAAHGNNEAIHMLEVNQATDLAQAKLREEKRFQEERKVLQRSVSLDILTQNEQELASIHEKYDAQIEALKEHYSEELQLSQEFQTALAEIEDKRTRDLVLKDQADRDQQGKKEKDFALSLTQEIADSTFSLMSSNRQEETQFHIDEINRQREAELANKNLTEEQKKSINEKYDKQIRAEKLRAWEADKAASIAQAVIQGALAFVRALATGGPFAAAAVAVATTAQMAVMLGQKAPKFARGGYLPQGPLHSAGGISLIDPHGRKVGEIEGGEPILSRETYRNNRQLIDALLYSSQRLNGAQIAINTQEVIRADRMYRQGGIAPSSTTITNHTVNTSTADLSVLIAELRELQLAVREEKKRPVEFNYRLLEEHRDKIDSIRADVEA